MASRFRDLPIVNKIENGLEFDDDKWRGRASHRALVSSLNWVKGPLFLDIDNCLSGFDMLWLSSFNEFDIFEILPLIKSDVLDKEVKMMERNFLHFGPVFTSLYWVSSGYGDLKKKWMLADIPMVGAFIRYNPGAPEQEIRAVYKKVRQFIESNLRKKGFSGQYYWGFLDTVVASSNIFYLSPDKKIIHSNDINSKNGSLHDHSFFFELIDAFDPNFVGNKITFSTPNGKIAYNADKLQLKFDEYANDRIEDSENFKVVETFEIPLREFTFNIRLNAINFTSECLENSDGTHE